MALALSCQLFLNGSMANTARRAFLSRFHRSFSTFHAGNDTKTPPRKGRQAVRRLLKLLSPDASTQPQTPSLSRAVTALSESPESVSSASAAALISAAANPLLAFDFYRFLRVSASFHPEPDIFIALLRCQLLSISPAVFRIHYYLEEMRRRGMRIPPPDLRALVDPLLPTKLGLVRQFVEEVEGVLGLDPGLCVELMDLYAENGLAGDAIAIAGKARAAAEGDDALDAYFYCKLLGLYSAVGDAKSAMKVFAEMRGRRLSVSEAAYADLLRVLHRAGWLRLCWAVLEDMVGRCDGLRLDEHLGADLARAFMERGMVAQAEILKKKEVGTGLGRPEGQAEILFKEGVLKGKEVFEEFGTLSKDEKEVAFVP